VGRSGDGVHLLVAGKLGPLGPGAGCEDSARGAITSLDWVLVVVDPTVAALQMAIHLERLVAQVRAGVPPATRHLDRPDLVALAIRQFREAPVRGVRAVLNRVQSEPTEAFLVHALERDGPSVLAVLGEDPAIQDQWLRGARLASNELTPAALRLAEWLEQASREEAVLVSRRSS
jgi:CO dehydrogenase nickel-insertion accessory protein CooC1